MKLMAIHTTRYLYSEPASMCHTEVHLKPREFARQPSVEHELEIEPEPADVIWRQDYFGNEVAAFAIDEPHRELLVTSRSVVECSPAPPPNFDLSPAWETVAEEKGRLAEPEWFEAAQYRYPSPGIRLGPAFAEFARESFAAGRPFLSAVADLSKRIHAGFEYDPRATTVTTPVDEVLETRRGVCQDFAHFMISCLRSLGLPARYVSGYVRTGGQFTGADASHAWVSAWCPVFGWQDFDPTNNVMPHGDHVTLAWGRDYSDVAPVKGVTLSGGEQVIGVSVDVTEAV
jgi:transglutaminase-like putative cysteine protease